MRSIPRTQPSLLFEAEAPLNSAPWLETPVVDGGRVLLAGGGVTPERGMVTALAAIDARDGTPLWQVDLETNRELIGGLPCPLADGGVLLPIVEDFAGAEAGVLFLDRAGGIGEHVAVFGESDEGSSPPSIRAAAAPGGKFLLSWRGSGPARTSARRLGEEKSLWEETEWLCGLAGEVAILQTDGPEGALLARRVSKGGVLWESAIRAAVVAHVSDSMILAIDARERRAEAGVADEDWDEHLGSRAPSLQSDVLGATAALVVLDPATGAERWRRALDADVTSAIAAPHAVCAIAARGRKARLVRFARDGSPIGESPVPGPRVRAPSGGTPVPGPRVRAPSGGTPVPGPPAGRESDPNAWPTLIAVDHTHVLWATRDLLVCEMLADPGRRVWEIPLPVPGRGFHVGPIEGAIAERSIAVADERIFLRERNRLWCFGVSG